MSILNIVLLIWFISAAVIFLRTVFFTKGDLTLKDCLFIFICMIFAPLTLFVFALEFYDTHKNKVIIKRKK